MIDSSPPDMQLPMSACQAFEQVFGLTYDPTTDLYLVDDSIHAQLQELDPSVTFRLGFLEAGGPSVNITLPYGAFDLQASSPIYPNTTNYFPLRHAANSTQYTLGSTFLQEAYVIADYEGPTSQYTKLCSRIPTPHRSLRSTRQTILQRLALP